MNPHARTERRQMPDTLESLAAEYGLDIDKPTEGYPLTRLMACALLWRTRAERAEADLAAARNDVVLAQDHGARWLAELQKAEADRERWKLEVIEFTASLRNVARQRDEARADREQLRAALAELVRANDAVAVLYELSVIERDDNWDIDEREASDALAAAWEPARALAAHKEECAHEWVSARNEVITSGEWCPKCNAIRKEEKPNDA